MILGLLLVCLSVITVSGQTSPGCLSTITTFSECLITGNECSCLSTFINSAATSCTSEVDSAAQLAACTTANIGNCAGVSCSSGTNPACITASTCATVFANCTTLNSNNQCPCYGTYSACVAVTACTTAIQASLKQCVGGQFTCASLLGTCTSTSASVAIADLKTLFDSYANNFLSVWNNALTNVSITISTYTYAQTGNQIVFTLPCNWNVTRYTNDQIKNYIIAEFASTIGVPISQLTAVVKQNAKRDVQQTTGTVTVTANGQGNGSSMVSVFLAPILLLNGLLFFFFH